MLRVPPHGLRIAPHEEIDPVLELAPLLLDLVDAAPVLQHLRLEPLHRQLRHLPCFLLGPDDLERGEDAVIGPDTTLKDCEVGAGARVVRTHGVLAVIGSGATVWPFSYLRPGTRLGDRGKIGAYVETKNADIGEGSKVPHLSYVGDATIGVGTNIGAGTIFANYDGSKKHRTTVGDGAKTGSNNTFIAPVHIGDGAMTGGGTVVRQDVPPGALAVSAGPQRNIEGHAARKKEAAGERDTDRGVDPEVGSSSPGGRES